jgi:hypothetical protein
VAITTATDEGIFIEVKRNTIRLSRTPILPGIIIIANPRMNETVKTNMKFGK